MIIVTSIIAFLLGAAVGSFINVVIDRSGNGQPFAASRSRCLACGLVLGPLDLIPIASYLWLRGRCRRCKSAIGSRLLVVELTSGLLFLAGYLRFRPAGHILTLSAIGVALLAYGAARIARRG